jgi:UDP-glucose 4-epimerase
MGRRVGRAYVLIGPATRLPLTHVENCADAIVAATESRGAIGRVFNVVDGDDVRVWRYAREHSRGTDRRGVPIPVPYAVGMGLARLAGATSRVFFGPKGKLPSLLTPQRFEAQFKPLRYSNRRLREVLGWTPPLSFRDCLARTYGAR